jgi:hypothetical protein
MKKFYLIILFVYPLFLPAQNLILNPGFETGTPAYNTPILPASWPQLVGLWEFNNSGTPLVATVGSNLTLVGTHTTIAGYGGPDNAIRIGVGSHYNVVNPIGPNGAGGASYTNRYTLLFDFRVNASAIWRSFYQTNTSNANDGELFVRNTDGLIGVGSYSVEGAITNVWHRLIVSVRNGGGGAFEVFLDGRRVLSLGAQATDGRWSLESTFKIFADDSGDDGLIDVSTVALFNTDLTQAQMESLGRWTCNNWTGMGNYQQQIRNGGYPAAFAGTYYCYAGSDVSLTAEQVVDVSSLSAPIDAGIGIFTFSGRLQTYTQSPQDQARIVVEYRNAALTVLATYDTGNQTTSSVWTLFSNTQAAPVGTRNVRIRLISTKNNGVSNDCYYDQMSLTFSSPLPVELLSFTGKQHGTQVKLHWSTATETNCSHFNVERSVDLQEWTGLARLNGAGTTNQMSYYEGIDVAPQQDNYYRLIQVDYNGDSHIYGPIYIQFKYTEPLIETFQHNLHIVNTTYDRVEVYNLQGEQLLQIPLSTNQLFEVNTDVFTSGIYVVVLRSGAGNFTKKLFLNH